MDWAKWTSAASGARPSAFSTRTPVAASSTSVVRSPSWSCTRRDSTLYRRSNLVQKTSTGANIAPVIRPSHQFRWMSSAVTPKNITMLVIRKTIPNPANRRMDDRSVVARDSSWPDCHSSWNAGSSRCRCAYRSSLIVFSMSATALPCTQRRIRLSMADATPRAIAAMPRGISRLRSWCAMAPSITDLTSSGIATSAPSAARAATIIAISWKRYGRR